MKQWFGELYQIAITALQTNIVETKEGPFLAAGGHHFRSFWTRDFCFASSGLMHLGREDVVKNHLEKLLQLAEPESGLIPRSLDNMDTFWRVALGNFGFVRPYPQSPLKPEYLGEHKTPAIDGNALTILTCIELALHTGDNRWFAAIQPKLQKLLNFYQSDFDANDKAFIQGPFEDWQDSANRSGPTSYLHLMIWRILELNEDLQLKLNFLFARDQLTDRILDLFWDPESGLLLSRAGHKQISLDAQLLSLKWGFWGKPHSISARDFYRRLTHHPIWNQPLGPGLCTIPSYPSHEVSWTTKLVGLKEYHGQLYWSWLMGLAAQVARKMMDSQKSKAILNQLTTYAERDGTICEIYDPKSGKPFRSLLYHSEHPFSWGAGLTIDSLS